MKYLVVGDTHCKTHILPAAEQSTEWDMMIFLGDACDDWGATQGDNIVMLKQLIDLKKKYNGRFVWLIGNHDWGYYDPSIRMSGHIRAHEKIIHDILAENVNLWQVAARYDGMDFSHAGISNNFIRELETTDEKCIAEINALRLSPERGNLLNEVGRSCGGLSPVPSPIWARPEELGYCKGKNIQIVGHTPVDKIQIKDNIIICDTWSTMPNGEPIGDQSFLLIDNGIFKSIDINGNELEVIYDSRDS